MNVAVLLSGGVDSSVALYELVESGHNVTAFYLRIWLEDELAFLGNCPWEEDLNFARSVCDKLGVKFEIINMQQEYLDTVVDYTVRELKSGRTPSPDVMCNRHIKFGLFFNKLSGGFDKVASGHYAMIEEKEGLYYLVQSPDPVKDQTYFLTYLSQEQLSKIIFPIGAYTKKEVRLLAEQYNLPTKSRPDSQGICFLGKIKYNDFIRYHLGEKSGKIIEVESGRILGEHRGYWFYTIGQRQGMGLSGGPWFVARKDLDENIIFVSRIKDSDSVPRDKLKAVEINWIPKLPEGENFKVKLRHGPKKIDARISIFDNNKAEVYLSNPDTGIAAGQFVIFYRDNYCHGGGIIELL